MTKPQQQAHTPGPWYKSNTAEVWASHDVRRVASCLNRKQDNRTVYEIAANTALICAAVTSYDKHCGPRAVSCAEADLLGEALAALRALGARYGIDRPEIWAAMPEAFKADWNALRAVLAKASGEANVEGE